MKSSYYSFLFACAISSCTFIVNNCSAQIITHIGGSGSSSYSGDGGAATAAGIYHPFGVKTDNAGNIIFADHLNNRVRKINPTGVIITIAGGGSAIPGDGGPATAADLDQPVGIAIDNIGNIYFSDLGNSRIRRVDTSGIITTVAGTGIAGFSGDGGPATAAQLDYPQGMAIDTHGNLYFTEETNHRVRKIDTSGIITTAVGSGPTGLSMGSFTGDGGAATAARLKQPYGVFVDNAGNIYVADSWNNRIRKVDTAGIITTVAGGGSSLGDGGPATAAQILVPIDIAVDLAGNMYISDGNGCRIRKVSTTGTIITSVAGDGVCNYSGDGGMATASEVNHPGGVALDECGNVFITDWGNNRIRKINNCIPTTVFTEQVTESALKVHPNPNCGVFSLNLVSGYSESVKIIVSDITGQKIKEYLTSTNHITDIMLNVPTGMYIINASSLHGIWNKKLVVQ